MAEPETLEALKNRLALERALLAKVEAINTDPTNDVGGKKILGAQEFLEAALRNYQAAHPNDPDLFKPIREDIATVQAQWARNKQAGRTLPDSTKVSDAKERLAVALDYEAAGLVHNGLQVTRDLMADDARRVAEEKIDAARIEAAQTAAQQARMAMVTGIIQTMPEAQTPTAQAERSAVLQTMVTISSSAPSPKDPAIVAIQTELRAIYQKLELYQVDRQGEELNLNDIGLQLSNKVLAQPSGRIEKTK